MRRDELDQPDRLARGDERQHHERPMAGVDEELDLRRVGGRVEGVDQDRRLLLEDALRQRVRRDVEEGRQLDDGNRWVVADARDPVLGTIPPRDRAFLDAGHARQVAGKDVRDLVRVEAAGELAADVEEHPQLAGERLVAGEVTSGFEGGRGLVGEDREEPLVVAVELVQPELGQGDHADDRVVVAHRHDQHRFIDVVGARDRRPPRVVVRVADEERLAMLADPAREAHPEAGPQDGEVDVLVRADAALEGDRDEVAGRLEDVHPGVVVVDDPAGLLDDGPADGLAALGPAQARGCGLEDLELAGEEGGDRRLGRADRDVRSEGRRRDRGGRRRMWRHGVGARGGRVEGRRPRRAWSDARVATTRASGRMRAHGHLERPTRRARWLSARGTALRGRTYRPCSCDRTTLAGTAGQAGGDRGGGVSPPSNRRRRGGATAACGSADPHGPSGGPGPARLAPRRRPTTRPRSRTSGGSTPRLPPATRRRRS